MDLNKLIQSAPVDVTCPGCKHAFQTTIGKMQTGNVLTCPSCKGTIKLEVDRSSLDSETREAQRAMDDLNRTIRRLGGR